MARNRSERITFLESALYGEAKKSEAVSKAVVQWLPAITKCHRTEKNVGYSEVFVIAKTPL